MASDKSTDFIKRNRPPRVNISYEDPYDSEKMVELPFVLGVMSDLSGNASEVDKPEMEERDFVGLWATSVQHQIDHINGKMFFDHLWPVKRKMLIARSEKLRRRGCTPCSNISRASNLV